MRIATWNVNGIRARAAQLCDWIERDRPDILCLQELKAAAAQIPAECKLPEYHAYWHCLKGYSGVSLHIRRDLAVADPVFSHAASGGRMNHRRGVAFTSDRKVWNVLRRYNQVRVLARQLRRSDGPPRSGRRLASALLHGKRGERPCVHQGESLHHRCLDLSGEYVESFGLLGTGHACAFHDESDNPVLRDDGTQRMFFIRPRDGAFAPDVYYKSTVSDLSSIRPMPSGLRMIAGDAAATGPARSFAGRASRG